MLSRTAYFARFCASPNKLGDGIFADTLLGYWQNAYDPRVLRGGDSLVTAITGYFESARVELSMAPGVERIGGM